MIDLTIGMVTYNNDLTIAGALEALFKHMPASIQTRVYVIDNASSEKTKNEVTPYLDCVQFIVSEKGNIGFGAANNLVMDSLDSRYHLILNPDVYLLDNDSILKLIAYLDSNPDVGMAVPKIVDQQGQIQYLCRRNPTVLDLFLRFFPFAVGKKRQDRHVMKDKDYNTPFEVEFASGCFMMIRTELFRHVGGFDEKFFLYAEDADLTRRVNQTTKTVYVPQAVVNHAWQRASYRNPAMTRIHIKSLWHYFRKWGFRFK